MKVEVVPDKGGYRLCFTGMPKKMLLAVQRAVQIYGMHCYNSNEVAIELDKAVKAGMEIPDAERLRSPTVSDQMDEFERLLINVSAACTGGDRDERQEAKEAMRAWVREHSPA